MKNRQKVEIFQNVTEGQKTNRRALPRRTAVLLRLKMSFENFYGQTVSATLLFEMVKILEISTFCTVLRKAGCTVWRY